MRVRNPFLVQIAARRLRGSGAWGGKRWDGHGSVPTRKEHGSGVAARRGKQPSAMSKQPCMLLPSKARRQTKANVAPRRTGPARLHRVSAIGSTLHQQLDARLPTAFGDG